MHSMDNGKHSEAVASFIKKWKLAAGSEKQETHIFWIELSTDVCNATRAGDIIEFEKPVNLKHKSFIDGYIA